MGKDNILIKGVYIQGKENAFVLMGDRWKPKNAIDGRYIWLPITIENDQPVIKWDLSVFE